VSSFIRGATMLPMAVFDIDRVVEMVVAERITVLPGPPTLYHSLLAVDDKSKLAPLRVGVTGAADIPVELIRRAFDELPFQLLATGYGLTEGGTATLSRPGDSPEEIATTAACLWVGWSCISRRRRGLDARLHGDAGLPRRPDRHRRTIDPDGWLHTGDLGHLTDSGRLKIVGARRTCSSSAGSTHTRLRSKASCWSTRRRAGRGDRCSDDRLGQVGKAFIVVKDGRTAISCDELIEWSRDRMAGFKVPRFVEFLNELPLNATGKVMKNRLR